MPWKKTSVRIADAFDAALPDDARVERRQMFGYPCAFVNRHMFAGTHEDRLLVRLADTDRESLLGDPAARPFEPMPGRVMREYVVVPPALVDDTKTLSSWVLKAFRYAATLPPKPAKKPTRGKTRSRAAKR